MKVGLLRHGRTDWNNAGLLQGRTDRPLDATEAERLGTLSLPESWQGADILASPLSRAVSTVECLTGITPRTNGGLTEMNFGEWEGQAGRTLLADPESGFKNVEEWGWTFRPPRGETPQEVWNRVAPVIRNLRRNTLIVCHMVVMRVILAKAHHWEFKGPPPFQIKRDRIYGVSIEGTELYADAEPVRLVPR